LILGVTILESKENAEHIQPLRNYLGKHFIGMFGMDEEKLFIQHDMNNFLQILAKYDFILEVF
jgi:hypothetical protein